MQKLTRNRLIGGAVLVFAGMLFIPIILTPENKTINNPHLSIHVQPNNPVSTASTSFANKTDANASIIAVPENPPALQLESLDAIVKKDEVIAITTPENLILPSQPSPPAKLKTSAKEKSSNFLPITLTSLDNKAVTVNKASSLGKTKDKPAKKNHESWVRVGSFSNMANADELTQKLEKQHFSVKIENKIISGTLFRRVLVGPFSNDAEIRAALKKIKSEDFSPSTQ
ncbi:MAG: SPOR domain-containing protein [Ostreibacterium sp.]